MSQHAGLDVERWSAFDVDQQVLMIANELNRVSGPLLAATREASPRSSS